MLFNSLTFLIFLPVVFGVDDFTDPAHLNLEGTTKFSKKLKQYIEAVVKPRHSGRAGAPSTAADGGGTPSLSVFATASIEKERF